MPKLILGLTEFMTLSQNVEIPVPISEFRVVSIDHFNFSEESPFGGLEKKRMRSNAKDGTKYYLVGFGTASQIQIITKLNLVKVEA